MKKGEEDEKIEKKLFVPTKIQAFNLTKPKPKDIPQPIIIPKVIHSNPIPDSLFKTDLHKIQEEKKKNLEETKKVFHSIIQLKKLFIFQANYSKIF